MHLTQADADGNGTIDYEEFITATVHMNRMDREEHLYTAFQYFDKDNSGQVSLHRYWVLWVYVNLFCNITELCPTFMFFFSFITKEELEQALKEQGLYDGNETRDIISEADADNVSRSSPCTNLHLDLCKATQRN